MPKRIVPKPTEGELAILQVLGRRGPSTVRAVMEELNRVQETGYTTVFQLMQIITTKGLVRREESQRTPLYEAAFSEADTQRRLLGDLLDRAFSGSAHQLVLQALATKKASPAELAEIRKLLDTLEGGGK